MSSRQATAHEKRYWLLKKLKKENAIAILSFLTWEKQENLLPNDTRQRIACPCRLNEETRDTRMKKVSMHKNQIKPRWYEQKGRQLDIFKLEWEKSSGTMWKKEMVEPKIRPILSFNNPRASKKLTNFGNDEQLFTLYRKNKLGKICYNIQIRFSMATLHNFLSLLFIS